MSSKGPCHQVPCSISQVYSKSLRWTLDGFNSTSVQKLSRHRCHRCRRAAGTSVALSNAHRRRRRTIGAWKSTWETAQWVPSPFVQNKPRKPAQLGVTRAFQTAGDEWCLGETPSLSGPWTAEKSAIPSTAVSPTKRSSPQKLGHDDSKHVSFHQIASEKTLDRQTRPLRSPTTLSQEEPTQTVSDANTSSHCEPAAGV